MYRALALVCFNLALFLLITNAFAAAALAAGRWLDGRRADPVTERYGEAALLGAYPGKQPNEVRALLAESWGNPLIFEPFTQTRETPFRGRYVTVDSAGFRHSVPQGPWPPDTVALNIFLFGGSTTFSYGLPDDETVGSYLQRHLQERLSTVVHVYNFGRAWYYTTQERILFERLLAADHRPDWAIFLDGLNDFRHYNDQPFLTGYLRQAVNTRGAAPSPWRRMPVLELGARALNKLRTGGDVPNDGGSDERRGDAVADVSDRVRGVVRRMDHNMQMIAAVADRYEIRVQFAIQPVPTYGYDLSYHRFGAQFDFGAHALSGTGYHELARQVAEGWGGESLTWCADIQQGIARSLYVDAIHFSAELAEMVAECIADDVVDRIRGSPGVHRGAVSSSVPSRRPSR